MMFKVERRLHPPGHLTYLLPALSIIGALSIGALLLFSIGVNPLRAYIEMFSGAFGSTFALTETLVKAIPLMLAGIAISIAFTASFWNIGAEGQLQLGALGATFIALTFPTLPAPVLIPLMIAVAFIAGGLWGLIPALLKVKMEVDEIVSTIMLNYIAILLVYWFIYWPWLDPLAYGHPRTPLFVDAARMPRLIGRLHATIFLAIALAILLYVFIRKTRVGYEIRVIGDNPSAAKYAGINIFRKLMLVMLISGGVAGIAGFGEVSGLHNTLLRGFSPGYGYTAIIVAWLARRNPIAVLPIAFLIGGLINGGYTMQYALGIPLGAVFAIQGLILLFIIASEIISHYKITISWRG